MLELYGLKIETSKNVYEPSDDSLMTIEALEKLLQSSNYGISVLDIGTGTGIIGLYAAKSRKVSYVALADINPNAVALAKSNVAENIRILHASVEVFESNLFSKINGDFDIIVFNAPYLRPSHSDHGMISKAWNGGKEGIAVSLRFLKEAKSHVKSGGKVILLASSFGNIQKLTHSIEKYGAIIDTIKRHFFFEDLYAFTIQIASNNSADNSIPTTSHGE